MAKNGQTFAVSECNNFLVANLFVSPLVVLVLLVPAIEPKFRVPFRLTIAAHVNTLLDFDFGR